MKREGKKKSSLPSLQGILEIVKMNGLSITRILIGRLIFFYFFYRGRNISMYLGNSICKDILKYKIIHEVINYYIIFRNIGFAIICFALESIERKYL